MLRFMTEGKDDFGVNSVRYFEKINAAVMCALVYIVTLAFFGSILASTISAFLLTAVHFHSLVIWGGNSAEEWANSFYLFSILLCCPQIPAKFDKPRLVLIGFVSCLAGLVKEPYVILCLPWLLFAVWQARNAGLAPWKGLALQAAGVVAALLPFFFYFLANGTLSHWVNLYLIQFSYIDSYKDVDVDRMVHFKRIVSSTWFSLILMAFAALSLLNWRFVRQHAYLPVVAFIGFAFAVYGSLFLAHRIMMNYVQALIPSWCILQALGVAFFITPGGSLPDAITRPLRKIFPRKHVLGALAGLAVAMIVVFNMSYSRLSHGIAMSGVIAFDHARTDYEFFQDRIYCLRSPFTKWSRPTATTLDALLPRQALEDGELMIMHQRISFYAPLHGFLTPEGTRPFFGISNGLVAMRPDYLGMCLDSMKKKPPAVFIGNGLYEYVIEYLAPVLDSQYVCLGKMPLFFDHELFDRDFAILNQTWYVRKDLFEQVDMKLVNRLQPKE
jgi:hypothetical protein